MFECQNRKQKYKRGISGFFYESQQLKKYSLIGKISNMVSDLSKKKKILFFDMEAYRQGDL